MLISAVPQSDSVIHRYTFFSIFFSIMVYPRRLDIVSLCYTVGPCLSILAPANPKVLILRFLALPFPLGNHQSVLYVLESFCFVDKFICVI